MSDTWKTVLNLLASGERLSGSAIGEQLGISRTAVWKHVRQLQEWGIPVRKLRGQGYQMEGGIELLSHDRITSRMSPDATELLRNLHLLDHIDSTNSYAKNLIEAGRGAGQVCLAERQTQGRGRLGRTWVSPFGRNIYLSVTWEFDQGIAVMEGLSLAVGVVVCRAIRELGIQEAGLKWPNDILLGDRKVGGILLEMLGDPVGPCQVVVGIGINFAMPTDAVIDQPWADLGGYATLSRNGLAATVISKLLPLLSTYADLGFTAYRDAWEGFDTHRGESVCLISSGKTISGIARGVSDTGAIRLEVDGEEKYFSGGEISLRRAH